MPLEIEEINERIDELHQQVRAFGHDSMGFNTLIDELENLQKQLKEHGRNHNNGQNASTDRSLSSS